jgi:hypothetical protein
MKPPRFSRTNAKHREIGTLPDGIDIAEIAAQVRYVGSVNHKDLPSFAGIPPRPRPDASICPRYLARDQSRLQQWLVGAILSKNFGNLWDGTFPRYVWHRESTVVFEARHLGQGQYKGYPLSENELVRGLQ